MVLMAQCLNRATGDGHERGMSGSHPSRDCVLDWLLYLSPLGSTLGFAGLFVMIAVGFEEPTQVLFFASALVGGVAAPFLGVEAARARLDWEAAHVALFRVEGRRLFASVASSSLPCDPTVLSPPSDSRCQTSIILAQLSGQASGCG